MGQVEVITRVERRRKWSEAEKAAVLAETDIPGNSVASVARKHGIAKSVLYNWRAVRNAQAVAAMPGGGPVEFLPIGVVGRTLATPVPPVADDSENTGRVAHEPTETGRAGVIEIDLPNGVRLRVDARVSEKALRRVLQAMKGAV